MTQRFLVLDSFRGLCALSVVVFHLHIVGTFTESAFFRGASLLVEFFFVLSGFVLAHGYAFKEISFVQFTIKRTFRLFPLHIFMLMVFIVFEFGKLAAFELGGLSFNNPPFTGPGDPLLILPNLFLVHAWSSCTNALAFDYPSWSISIEYYTYFIFFISVFYLKKSKILAWTSISLTMLVLIAMKTEFPASDVQRGLSCFFAGALTYSIYSCCKHLKVSYLCASLLEALLLITAIYTISSDIAYKTIVETFLFCIIILIYSFEAGILSSILKGSFFTRLGAISYSIYMTHAAIIFILFSLLMILQKITGLNLTPTIDEVRFITTGNEYLNNVLIFVVLAAVVFVSLFTNKYIEKAWQRKAAIIVSKVRNGASYAPLELITPARSLQ